MWIQTLKPNGTYSVTTDPSARVTSEPTGVGSFGVKLFLASLSFLFAASILLYLILLVPADKSQIDILPVVGPGLGVATLVMLASSFTYARALKHIRADRRDAFKRAMTWTMGLGLAFMIAQSVNWAQLFASDIEVGFQQRPTDFEADPRAGGLFLVMTVLHALHVIGGLIPLWIVTAKARRGDYTASHHEGAANVALYWHFLDVVWLLMLVAIVVVSV